MSELDNTGKLFAQIIALRLVVQDILGRQAAASGDFKDFLRRTHAGVADDLTRVELNGEQADLIRLHIETAIDDIFAPVREGASPDR